MAITWPDQIVEALARRRAVIVLGSGISANARTAGGISPPIWSVFLEDAYKELNRNVPHIKQALVRFEYLNACDYLKTEYGNRWPSLLRSKFVTPRFRSVEIHETIFNLDSRIVASLNFDKIFETYAIAASDGTVVVKNYYDDDIRQVLAGSGRYILKPHGDIDTVKHLIFTHREYSTARTNHATFYEMINALLHTHTFVMLGCGLSDPDLQVLFEDYAHKFDESAHFMTYSPKLAPAERALVEQTRGITLLPYSSRNGHAELKDSLKQLVKLTNAKRQELAADYNW